MRILHVLRTLDPAWGGPVEGARNLTGRALARGYRVEVVCLDDAQSPWLLSWRPTVHALGRAKSTYGFTNKLDRWLIANIRRFDAVVVHGIWMYFSYAVWKVTRKAGVPYFLFIHGALDPWFKTRYPLKNWKKIAYWILIENRIMRDANAALFTTEEEKRLAHNAFFPYNCNPAVIGYGIVKPITVDSFDSEAFTRELTASHPVLRNRTFLLFLARIHEKKGIDLLLKAFAASRNALADTAIVVAGPGSHENIASFANLAASLGIAGDVVPVGPVYGEKKYALMRAADAYVLPSHQENFGISIVEALACGTPVLISNKVNIWREIQAANAGLVDDDDIEGTTRLLQNWAALPSEYKLAMRSNAKRCFEENFDIAVTSDRFFDVLFAGCVQPFIAIQSEKGRHMTCLENKTTHSGIGPDRQ